MRRVYRTKTAKIRFVRRSTSPPHEKTTAYVFLLTWSSVRPVAAQDDLDRSFQRAEIRSRGNGRIAYYHWAAEVAVAINRFIHTRRDPP